MSEAILPTQAIEQKDHQTKDWFPAKVTYTVLMAIALLSHIWLMLIGAGIDDIPIYFWIIRLLTVPFAISLGKLWKDRGFQILSVYFLLFFFRSYIPNPGSIFSVEVSESIPGALWLFAGCYGLAKILTPDQLKRFLIANAVIWIAGMVILSCLGIYAAWTDQSIDLLGGSVFLYYGIMGDVRLDLVYVATTSGAIISFTILFGAILALCVNNRLCKVVLLLMMIPLIIAMALTDSRTAFISVSVGLAIMAFYGIFKYCQNKAKERGLHRKANQWRAWILGILIMSVVFVLLIIILLQITPAFNRIRSQGIITRSLAEETKKIDITARGFTNGQTILLTGRAELWTEIINYINQNKLILLAGRTKQAPLFAIESYYGHCHCLYLQVLLESGIPGLLCVLAFIVYTIINVYKTITNTELLLWIRLLPAIIISLIIADLVECFLWLRASNAPMTTVFFISTGIVNTLASRQKLREKAMSESTE